MRWITILFLSIVVSFSALTHTSIAAEDNVLDETITQTSAIVETLSQESEQISPVYDGIIVEEPTKLPSGFGMFWRGIKENVSLALTFDPNKKAEKAIQFSEERMLIAEKALESENPKLKESAQKNLDKAQKFLEKAEESQQKALEKPNKETERLLKNRATNADRQQEIFDRLEKKTKGDGLDQVLEVRQQMNEENQRLETAINNDNIPEDVRKHLIDVKERIEHQATEVTQRVTKIKELQDSIKQGDESAIKKFEEFTNQRIEEVKNRIDEHQVEFQKFQTKLQDIQTKAEQGNKKAVEMMKQIEKMPNLQNRLENFDQNNSFQGTKPFNEQEGQLPQIKEVEQNQQTTPGFFQKVKGFFKQEGDQIQPSEMKPENNIKNERPDIKPANEQSFQQNEKEREGVETKPNIFQKVKTFFKQEGDQIQPSEMKPENNIKNERPDIKPANEQSFQQNEKEREGVETKPNIFQKVKGFFEQKEEGFEVQQKQEDNKVPQEIIMKKQKVETKPFDGNKNENNNAVQEFKPVPPQEGFKNSSPGGGSVPPNSGFGGGGTPSGDSNSGSIAPQGGFGGGEGGQKIVPLGN